MSDPMNPAPDAPAPQYAVVGVQDGVATVVELRDGMATAHDTPFLRDPRFLRAYARACTAMKMDLQLEWRLNTVIWAASRCVGLEGAFVECGVARGFMSSGICDYLDWTDRPFYLLDTFDPHEVDAMGNRTEHVVRFYAESPEESIANFAQWPGCTVIVGEIPGTLAQVPEGPVAYLHIDMNNPAPEDAALRHFWPRLSPDAIIVLDDYGWRGFEPSQRVANQFSADVGVPIFALPTGQGIMIKPHPDGGASRGSSAGTV